MGTIDNIFVLHGLITYLLNNNNKLYAAFVDFTNSTVHGDRLYKAFDYLERGVIWYKLNKYGVRGKMLDESVRSRIKYQNVLSEEFSCVLGAPQGQSLSPFLFAMYLNDIE
jgi:hypothetical protein